MLTAKQSKVLSLIEIFIRQNGIPPTVRELCKMYGVSSAATMARFLDTLQAKGYILKNQNSPRSIRVVKKVDV